MGGLVAFDLAFPWRRSARACGHNWPPRFPLAFRSGWNETNHATDAGEHMKSPKWTTWVGGTETVVETLSNDITCDFFALVDDLPSVDLSPGKPVQALSVVSYAHP